VASSGPAPTGPCLCCAEGSRAGCSTPSEVSPEQSRGAESPPSTCQRASLHAVQDISGLLVCERTLLAHVQLFIHQYPQVLLGRAPLNPFIPQPLLIGSGVALIQVQDLALGLVEPHEVHTGPLFHFSSLSRSLWMTSHPSGVSTAPLSLVSSANLLKVHSISLSH